MFSPEERVMGFTFGGIAQRGGGSFVNAVEPTAFRPQGRAHHLLWAVSRRC